MDSLAKESGSEGWSESIGVLGFSAFCPMAVGGGAEGGGAEGRRVGTICKTMTLLVINDLTLIVGR